MALSRRALLAGAGSLAMTAGPTTACGTSNLDDLLTEAERAPKGADPTHAVPHIRTHTTARTS